MISLASTRAIFRNSTVVLPLLICLIGAATASISIAVLFGASIEEDKIRLTQMVRGQASLMEAVAKFDIEHSADDHRNGSFGATMEQIAAAKNFLDGFGETGEFVIGKLIGGQVTILQKPRYKNDVTFLVPEFVPVPMKKALAGESGEIIATDYKGHQVLAAYHHVPILNIGLVAKIDRDEVYRPFIIAAAIAAGLTLAMLVFGVYASRKFLVPFTQLEDEKRRAEEYLNIAGTIIVALDTKGLVTMINRKGGEVLGHDVDAIVGKNWFETFIPESQRTDAQDAFFSTLNGNLEGAEHYENSILTKADGERLFSWHCTYLRDEDQQIVGCLSAGDDVTERREIERNIETSDRRFSRSQEFANIGTWDWNIQTGGLYWSERIAALFGYESGKVETTYDNFIAAIHPDDRQKVMDAVNACVADGVEYNIEHRIVRADGTVRYLLERGDVVRNENDQPLNMLGVVQDITAAKKAELLLQEAHQLNQTIFSNSPIGIAMYDHNGQCISANNATGTIIGATLEQVLAQNYHEIPSWKKSGLYEKALECLSTGGKIREDIKIKTSFGKDVDLDWHLSPINLNGEQHLLLMLSDITESKTMQAQLIQSSKMATLGEMATGVAHELNQPLNIIRMAVNNIQRKSKKDKADPEYLADKLDKIDGQVERASAIIDHMRIFGRKPEATPRPLDLKKTIENVLGLIGEQFRLASIEIATDAPQHSHPILGHQVQVEQVLLNLLGNARDTLHDKVDGEKRISITIGENAGSVFIAIEDTGGGIDAEVLPRIFEPFFTTKEVGQGTGLGLSISYGIINDMGGTITATNTDAGASFVISLPAFVDEALSV